MKNNKPIIKQVSKYNHLEKRNISDLLYSINKEHQIVATVIHKEISKINTLVDIIFSKIKNGGCLFISEQAQEVV